MKCVVIVSTLFAITAAAAREPATGAITARDILPRKSRIKSDDGKYNLQECGCAQNGEIDWDLTKDACDEIGAKYETVKIHNRVCTNENGYGLVLNGVGSSCQRNYNGDNTFDEPVYVQALCDQDLYDALKNDGTGDSSRSSVLVHGHER